MICRFIVLFVFYCCTASAEVVQVDNDSHSLYAAMQIAEDVEGNKTYNQIDQLDWVPTQLSYFNKEFSTSAYWLSATVSRSNTDKLFLLIKILTNPTIIVLNMLNLSYN